MYSERNGRRQGEQGQGGKESVPNHCLGFCFAGGGGGSMRDLDKKTNAIMCRDETMRSWEEGKSTANRMCGIVEVRGRPPESVNAVTVGTNQSQCLSNIDQTLGHTHAETQRILSDTHTQRTAYIHSHKPLSLALSPTHCKCSGTQMHIQSI